MTNERNGNVVRLSGIRHACGDCSLFELCLPVSLGKSDIDLLDEIVQRRRPLAKGDHLYRSGDQFHAIYAVRAGALKTVAISEDGEEQVTGFHLPGEMLGFDAINHGVHPCSAIALETTSVCEIPFENLEELAMRIPGLQHTLLRIMSKEIFQHQEMLHAVAKRTAEERLAIVLLSFSERYAKRGLSAVRFRLPMSRSDLSNYLGLAPETMSRLFKRFQEQGLVTSDGKEIVLESIDGLREMAHQSMGAGPSRYSRKGLV